MSWPMSRAMSHDREKVNKRCSKNSLTLEVLVSYLKSANNKVGGRLANTITSHMYQLLKANIKMLSWDNDDIVMDVVAQLLFMCYQKGSFSIKLFHTRSYCLWCVSVQSILVMRDIFNCNYLNMFFYQSCLSWLKSAWMLQPYLVSPALFRFSFAIG